MNKLARIVAVAALVAAPFAALAANPLELTEPCDLAEVTAPIYQQDVNCNVDTLTPFTLSADVDWISSSFPLNVTGGRTCFDFAQDGDHRLKLKYFAIDSATAPYVEFKGGIWDGGSYNNGGSFVLGTDGNPSDGRTVVFDGSSVTNFGRFAGLQGCNGTMIVTNGACLMPSTINPFGNLADAFRTNNLIHISAGSSCLANNSGSWERSGPGSAALMNNRMLVEGAGAVFRGAVAYNLFEFGKYSSGNELVARDGGALRWYSVSVGGSANAKSNTVFVTGAGTTALGEGSLTIGTAVGADYNRVIIADGADWKTQQYNGTSVGSSGSFNELVISNATLSRTYWVQAGIYAGASNNAVRLYGGGNPIAGTLYMFGNGRNNTWTLEDGEYFKGKSKRFFISSAENDGSTFKGRASTNNTVIIGKNTTVHAYDFNANVSSVSNTIFVGAGALLSNSHDMHIRGDGNSVILSNGTIACSQSGPGFCLGRYDKASSELFTERGNRIVFQGTCPALVRYSEQYNSSFKIYDNGIVRFELPPAGYPLYDDGKGSVTNSPLVRGVDVLFYGNGRLEFGGVTEHARTLTKPVDYQLTGQTFQLSTPDEGASMAKILATANAALPRGSYAYTSGDRLWLHVAPYRGSTLIIK